MNDFNAIFHIFIFDFHSGNIIQYQNMKFILAYCKNYNIT